MVPKLSATFSGKTYRHNRLYRFEDLPRQAKKDAALHFEEAVGDDPTEKEVRYLFLIMPQDDLMEMLDGSYGPTLAEKMDEPYILELEEDIRKNGLKSPPVGGEGMHRLLALARIGEGAPYFHIEYPE